MDVNKMIKSNKKILTIPSNSTDKKDVIVVVSGGFDPIHIGHLRTLKRAKKLGDKLIIILNNDNWLIAKKHIILMKCNERKEIMESLACVDKVVVTKHKKNPKDMSVNAALLEIRPDIFANGGDRVKNNVPEAKICEDIGCKRIYIKEEVRSSSKILKNYTEKFIKYLFSNIK